MLPSSILNLLICTIVLTMQELSARPDPLLPRQDLVEVLERMEADLKTLRSTVEGLRHPAEKH